MENSNSIEEFEKLTEDEKQELIDLINSTIEPRQTINRNITSYGIKDCLEKHVEVGYLSNGSVKGAMKHLGFKHTEDQNWRFNITQKSIKKLRNM